MANHCRCTSHQLKVDVEVQFAGRSCTVPAIWDTGSDVSCISCGVARRLGLYPTGRQTLLTPSGSSSRYVYCVDVELPDRTKVENLRVCDSAIGRQGLGMLIGMDVISKGVLTMHHDEDGVWFRLQKYM